MHSAMTAAFLAYPTETISNPLLVSLMVLSVLWHCTGGGRGQDPPPPHGTPPAHKQGTGVLGIFNVKFVSDTLYCDHPPEVL